MQKQYRYVGSSDLLTLLQLPSTRLKVQSAGDIARWIAETKQPLEHDGSVIVTCIVDLSGHLWINDRHSEHVLCAAGQNVLSAGEMTFSLGDGVEVIEVTNQSTGYYPEPDSWWAVARALQQVNIPHPNDFTTHFIFRKCEQCGTKNLIKDNWFVCAVCDADLPQMWNF